MFTLENIRNAEIYEQKGDRDLKNRVNEFRDIEEVNKFLAKFDTDDTIIVKKVFRSSDGVYFVWTNE